MGFFQRVFNGGDRSSCSSGDCGDASAALFTDCYERPPARGECANGGCGDFCYSCTDCNRSYYQDRQVGMPQGCCGPAAPMMLSGYMNCYDGNCGSSGARSGLARGFGGGFGGGMARGFLGGILGGFLGRLFGFGGFGGGGGGCDDGTCDNDLDDANVDAERYDQEREERYSRQRRLDREREEYDAIGRHSRDNTRANQVVDNVRGVSTRDKEDAKEMSTYERESLRLINEFRARNGLDPVQFDPRLQLSALVHSKYQNENGLGHTENEAGWRTPSQRMAQVGMKGWIENAAYGHMPTPQSLVNMWINSPGHRAALLNKNATLAGVSKHGRGATLNMV